MLRQGMNIVFYTRHDKIMAVSLDVFHGCQGT